jgi:hypothetical protein
MQVTGVRCEEAGMGRQHEPGGDYGYDLVHEELAGAADRPDDESRAAAPAPGPAEPAGDHGYDEAHDF